MLNDVLFVQESLIDNLYYLRTIQEFCMNIQLSFLENEQEYKTKAEGIRFHAEELRREVLKYANGGINAFALESEILVTKYTLTCEELTEKLFPIKIDTDITKQEVKLQPGVIENPSAELMETLSNINQQAYQITNDLIGLCQDIRLQQSQNELFSYSYPSLFDYMIEEARLFEKNLERLIQKDNIDPLFAIDYEYWFHVAMKKEAMFVRGLVDPIHEDVHEIADAFVEEFQTIINEYRMIDITPDTEQVLVEKSMDLVNRFRQFLSTLIERLLDKQLYFIVEPIFLDNMYTEANYFYYVLKTVQNKQENSKF